MRETVRKGSIQSAIRTPQRRKRASANSRLSDQPRFKNLRSLRFTSFDFSPQVTGRLIRGGLDDRVEIHVCNTDYTMEYNLTGQKDLIDVNMREVFRHTPAAECHMFGSAASATFSCRERFEDFELTACICVSMRAGLSLRATEESCGSRSQTDPPPTLLSV